MPRYSHQETTGSGVPLGGIGAGKVELFPDGTLSNFTNQNNWGAPLNLITTLNGIEARVGYHFGLYVADKSDRQAMLLQTVPVRDYSRVAGIDYHGRYPFATLAFRDKRLPVSVTLEAFSPLVPGVPDDSSCPAAVFLFHVRNLALTPVTAALFFSARNTVSRWNVGRFNTVVSLDRAKGVEFSSDRPLPGDESAGTVCVASDPSAGEVTVHGGWNLKTADPFSLTLENVDLKPAWEPFGRDGLLPNASPPGVIRGEAYELAGAVASRITLEPGEERRVPFILTWHTPVHHVGHAYERRFASAQDVADRVLADLDRLHAATRGWTDALATSPLPGWLPGWLADALSNNLYVFSSGTWYGRNEEFALFEAPEICQLMETVDVRFYSSLALAWLFPGLERVSLRQVAQAQRPDGYIPHDLGRGRLDLPSDGTTAPPRWKDLCPKFALMVYRDYLWSGDRGLLDEFYPSTKAAMLWEMAADHDGDGLPENEGADQTFDMWRQEGTQAYTSGIYLAALKACERMAGLQGDFEFRQLCASTFAKGQQAFIDLLWTGEFFRACSPANLGEAGEVCTVGQLVGQWYAHLLDLGYILPERMVKSAVTAMLRLNGQDSRFGATNAVYSSGLRDSSNEHARNIWPGATYALSALAIYEGMAAEGLRLAERVWTNITDHIKNPWNQPDVIRAADGTYGFGDHYMRNPVVWGLLFALARQDPRLASILDSLKGPSPS